MILPIAITFRFNIRPEGMFERGGHDFDAHRVVEELEWQLGKHYAGDKNTLAYDMLLLKETQNMNVTVKIGDSEVSPPF